MGKKEGEPLRSWRSAQGDRCRVTWTVHRFPDLALPPGCYVPSPCFSTIASVTGNVFPVATPSTAESSSLITNVPDQPPALFQKNEIKWYIGLFPNGRTEDFKEYVSLYLCVKDLEGKQVRVKAKLGVVTENYQEKGGPLTHVYTADGEGRGYGCFISRKEVLTAESGLLSESGDMTLFCEVRVESTDQGLNPSERAVIEDMENVRREGAFSDVTLSCAGQEMKAHKAILSARSAFFAELLKNDPDVNCINLEGIEPQVAQEILCYLYTGRVSDINSHAERLIVAAERFSLTGLVALCAVSLLDTLTVESAPRLLALAEKCPEVADEVIAYIAAFPKEVMSTPAWEVYTRTPQPKLLTEVLRRSVFKC